jgi:hypothetical protein
MRAFLAHPMRAALLLLTAAAAPAPSVAQAIPETIVLLRTATGDGTYHYAQLFHQRGRWIPIDFGYIDFNRPGEYREMWLGGGGVPVSTSNAALVTEAFLLKPFGDFAGDQLYLQLFFLGSYRLLPRVPFEAVYLPYIPLNDAGTTQHLLERAKVEYDFTRWKVGAGYGAYKFGEQSWSHKPFVTGTIRAGDLGSVELWLQRLPGDQASVQLRYAKVFAR